jgi:cell division protein ZapB
MISEFHDLSDKIDRLAALTLSLRRENAELRQLNASLSTENAVYMQRLGDVQRRVEALLEKIPALEEGADAITADDEEER